jgi:Ni2+-binding GTPase involved in maturation of urease and hydrogenase
MTKLTVRLHNERTGQLLGEVAKRYGVSKNQLIEQLLERELQAAAMVIEQDLTTTIEQLRRYRAAEHQEAAIEAVAQAEGMHPDPMQARRGTVAGTDAFGILDTFAGA